MNKSFARLFSIIFIIFNADIAYANNYQQIYKNDQYEKKMNRLSEVLGALQFLENLCNKKEPYWRNYLEQLIKFQQATVEQKTQRIEFYNYGYQSLKENYTTCTSTALLAEKKYLTELNSAITELLEKYRPN